MKSDGMRTIREIEARTIHIDEYQFIININVTQTR